MSNRRLQKELVNLLDCYRGPYKTYNDAINLQNTSSEECPLYTPDDWRILA